MKCQLVLAESFTAVVHLAEQDLFPTKTPTSLELKLFADYIEIRILEQGQLFSLLAYLIRHLAEIEGGRVIHFVPLVIDELCSFSLSDRRNCLVMRKRLVKDTFFKMILKSLNLYLGEGCYKPTRRITIHQLNGLVDDHLLLNKQICLYLHKPDLLYLCHRDTHN